MTMRVLCRTHGEISHLPFWQWRSLCLPYLCGGVEVGANAKRDMSRVCPHWGSRTGMMQRPFENDACPTGMGVIPYHIYSPSSDFWLWKTRQLRSVIPY